MSVTVDVHHRLGDFTLDARFESSGRLTALFGSSGAGKTSLVNLIAGLARPAAGRISVQGETLVDTRRGVFVPRHRRRLGYVFQEGRLFPHLSVRQNLLYGYWFTPRRERYGRLDEVVALLGIGHLLRRRPSILSGGEQQRVAIGRALLANPRLLLMDEPLASLDEARKAEIMPYIERLRDEAHIPIIYVSHAVPEVARLATTVVLLADGQVEASGLTGEILGRPELLPEIAGGEAGALLETTIARHDEAFGLTCLACAAGELTVPRVDRQLGTRLRVRVRARDVMLALTRPRDLSALNVLAATVTGLDGGDGPIADVELDCGGQHLAARLTHRSVVELGLRPGLPVFAVIKSIAFDSASLSRTPAFAGTADA